MHSGRSPPKQKSDAGGVEESTFGLVYAAISSNVKNLSIQTIRVFRGA